MYLKCLTCPELGTTCDGPNFLAMTPQQLVSWCKERKKRLGLTNARLAELSGMPQGTIDSLLANGHADFKFGTIRPLLQVLVGGDWSGDPCPGASDEREKELKELKEKIAKLESGIEWRDKEIASLKQDNDDKRTLIANTNARHAKSSDFLRDQIRFRNRVITVIGTLLGLSLAVIIGALIVDYLNRHIGFIWVDKLSQLFKGDGHGLLENWIA